MSECARSGSVLRRRAGGARTPGLSPHEIKSLTHVVREGPLRGSVPLTRRMTVSNALRVRRIGDSISQRSVPPQILDPEPEGDPGHCPGTTILRFFAVRDRHLLVLATRSAVLSPVKASHRAFSGRFGAFSPLPGQTLPVRARFVAFLL